jgi:hypothetical protein
MCIYIVPALNVFDTMDKLIFFWEEDCAIQIFSLVVNMCRNELLFCNIHILATAIL